MKLGLLGPGADDTTSADGSTVAKAFGAAQPPGTAVHGVSTAFELAVSSGEAGSARPGGKDTTNADVTAVSRPAGVARPLLGSHRTVPRQNLKSKGLLVKLGLLGPGADDTTSADGSTVAKAFGAAQPPGTAVHGVSTAFELAVSSGEAGSARPGFKDTTNADVTAVSRPAGVARPLLGSHRTVPRQNLKLKGLLVKLGLLGPGADDTTSADGSTVAKAFGAAQPPGTAVHGVSTAFELAVSSGEAGSARPRGKDTTNADVTAVSRPAGEARPLLGSHRTVPRQNLKSKGLLVKLGLLGPGADDTTSADGSTVAKAFGAAQPPGTAVHGVSTAFELAVSFGEAGSARPRGKDTTNADVTAVSRPAGEARPLLGSHRTVPRQNLKSKGLLVKLGLLGPGADDTTSADTTAAIKTVGEARLPRFVKYSVTSESEPVEAVTRVPRKSSVAHAEVP